MFFYLMIYKSLEDPRITYERIYNYRFLELCEFSAASGGLREIERPGVV